MEAEALLNWIKDRSFGEWVALASLFVAIWGLWIKGKPPFKKVVKAKKGSIAFGDEASGNTVIINTDKKDS